MPEKTISELFETAIESEKKLADLYRILSKKFEHLDEVYDFWKGMMRDESIHAKELSQVMSGIPEERLSSPADAQMLRKSRGVLELLEYESQRVGEVKNLNEAYELATDLENSEANNIMEFLISEFVPDKFRIDFIKAEIDVHLRKLIEFPDRFGDSDWRKNIPSKN